MSAPNNTSKVKTGANAIFFVILVLVALVFVNVIGHRAFKRVDFTEDKLYTLSPASKQLVKDLTDRMTVKAFISKDLPPPYSQSAQFLRDLLDEYAAASNGKLKWEAIDPGTDKALEEEAEKLKVHKVTRQTAANDKLAFQNIYLGISLQYNGQIESLPEIGGTKGLEYAISSRIKMMAVKKKKIVFATSEGELPVGDGGQQQHGGISSVRQFLEDATIESQPINGKLLADDVDALVIAGPKQAASPRAKFVIDQFLMRGKTVIFFVNGMVVSTPNGMPNMPGQTNPALGRKNDHGLDDLLEHYGFKIHDDIVMEPTLQVPGPVMVRGQLMLRSFPTFTAAVRLSSTHPITEKLKGVIFPLASSVEQLAGKQPGFEVTPLAQSSSDAWRQAGVFVMDGEAPPKPTADHGPFTYAFAGQGKLTSFFAGKPHPNEKGENVEAPAPNTSLPPGEDKILDESTGTAHIVVVGDSNFISDEYLRISQYVQSYLTGAYFAANIFGWALEDTTFAALRAKTSQARPLTVQSDATPSLVKWGNVVAIPLAFILFGLIRARLRRRTRESLRI